MRFFLALYGLTAIPNDAVKFMMISSDKKSRKRTDINVVEIASFNIIISNRNVTSQWIINQ